MLAYSHDAGASHVLTYIFHYIAAREVWQHIRNLPTTQVLALAGAAAAAYLAYRTIRGRGARRRPRTGGDRAWYRGTYLRSPHWRRTSAAARRRAGYRCEQCHRRTRLDVHHRTYERLGHERPEDLRALCRTCHDQAA